MTREEAIYRLNNTAWLGSDADRVATENAVQMAIEALQEQKTGKWIDITKSDDCFLLKCSECGNDYIENTDYCPYCGTRMVGEEE